MAIASLVLLLLYGALTFATLFVKNEKLRFSKLLAVFGIFAVIIHTVLFWVAESHWAILLTGLLLFLAYAITNGLLTKKPHFLHWIVRIIVSVIIFVLFII